MQTQTKTKTAPGLRWIKVATITTNPWQPRTHFNSDALTKLAASIAEIGLLQRPVVRAFGDGFQLACGERRLRAVRLASDTLQLPRDSDLPGVRWAGAWLEIECEVRDLTDQQMAEIAIEENAKRADITPIERAAAFQKMVDDFGLKQSVIAARAGMSEGAVSHALNLLKLPADVQCMITAGELSEAHGRVLHRYRKFPAFQSHYATIMRDEEITTKDAEKGVCLRYNDHRADAVFQFVFGYGIYDDAIAAHPEAFFKTYPGNYNICLDVDLLNRIKNAQKPVKVASHVPEKPAPGAALQEARAEFEAQRAESPEQRAEREKHKQTTSDRYATALRKALPEASTPGLLCAIGCNAFDVEVFSRSDWENAAELARIELDDDAIANIEALVNNGDKSEAQHAIWDYLLSFDLRTLLLFWAGYELAYTQMGFTRYYTASTLASFDRIITEAEA